MHLLSSTPVLLHTCITIYTHVFKHLLSPVCTTQLQPEGGLGKLSAAVQGEGEVVFLTLAVTDGFALERFKSHNFIHFQIMNLADRLKSPF